MTTSRLEYHLRKNRQCTSDKTVYNLSNKQSCHIESKHLSASKLNINILEPVYLLLHIRSFNREVPLYTPKVKLIIAY